MELYARAADTPAPRGKRASNGSRFDGDNEGLRRSKQAVLKLIDPDDPAWASIAAVLREMNDAGVAINEVSYEIAAKLGDLLDLLLAE